MANAILPISIGIDLAWSGLGTATSVTLRRASGKGSCEEIARTVAVNRAAEE